MLEAARNYKDIVRAIITISSPLKGLNKGSIPGNLEGELLKLFGDTIQYYLVLSGDDPDADSKVEHRVADYIQSGVEVYNFRSTDDQIARSNASFARSSLSEVDGYKLHVEFPMSGFYTPRPDIDSKIRDLVAMHHSPLGHPLVSYDIARIVGKEV